MTALLQDFRYALRTFAPHPGFAAVSILTLALGIGANAAIFSIINAVLLRPLPFPQPDRIVQVRKRYTNETANSISVPLFNDWKRRNQVCSQLAAFAMMPVGFNLAGRDLPERVPGARVTATFFQVLGVTPILGRSFLPEEDRPEGGRVAVLGYNLWRARFSANPDLPGQVITVDGQPYTVVGIMPPRFRFPAFSDFASGTDIWIPLQLPPESRDKANYLAVIGRLKPGITREQAAAQMTALTHQLWKESPLYVDEDEGVSLRPLHEQLVGNIRPVLLLLMAAVALVLLIACVNVANLFLSRAATRGKEIAIRAALGATRGRIVRLLTVESVLLAVVGGAAGLLLAAAGTRVIIRFSSGVNGLVLPQPADAGLDLRVLAFTFAVSVCTGILFGLAPAFSASRALLNECLKEGSGRVAGGKRHTRLSGLLVLSEVAFSVILLAGAGLLIQSFVRLAHVDPGFDPRHVLTFETTLPESRYGTPAALSGFDRRVLERVGALSGVEAAASVTTLPTQFGPDFPFSIPGRPGSKTIEESGDSQYRAISPDYFRVMRIPLLSGRYFTDGDTETSPGVVIINATMARQSWPHEDPLGRTIIIAKSMGPEWADRPRQVVGVVGDVSDVSLSEPAPPEMFVPYTQVPAHMAALLVRLIPAHYLVRTRDDPYAIAGATRRAVLAVDANEPIAAIKSMEDVLSGSISRWRFNMVLLGIFSALALVLAAVGIYGVLSNSVAQRTQEMGVRMALGAERGDVLRLVVRQGFRLVVVGVLVGALGALALTRFLSGLLYGVKPADPVTFAAACAVLSTVALLASYIPARRATKVDPVVALRYE